ncbi:DinB family protein [Sphingobacterium deserti]|uniref:DinB-like domain-containing protein n=1 Tax=Sphingobacterium deserti TaxID=1229276 RepID=A0A0B8T4T6_9SPHI|nr:DinB family protein [Sphingobacterium deserti]KGE12259.1 hypothetical protein DI53_3909 [Sphingobacterium deserti]
MEKGRMEKEVWMRGTVAGVPDLLQPVAHALLQVQEDAQQYVGNLQEDELWIKPAGAASVAFHLQHIAGVIDRMFTYAHNKSLTETQLAYLGAEGRQENGITKLSLVLSLHASIDNAVNQLKHISVDDLTAVRYLGRQRIPTTLIGLLFHAAEHSQRHIGQMLVTIKWITNSDDVKTC